ncbi:MAG: hypothetical protein CMN85_13795 [Spongiibacteraceae bacterium]|nr:hypothetical protein [Spongiibacteraceae bacterium]
MKKDSFDMFELNQNLEVVAYVRNIMPSEMRLMRPKNDQWRIDMNISLLPIAALIAFGLPLIAVGHEEDSSAQKNQSIQHEKKQSFKHDHRRSKGMRPTVKSYASGGDEKSRKMKSGKVHDHREVHK